MKNPINHERVGMETPIDMFSEALIHYLKDSFKFTQEFIEETNKAMEKK